MSPLPNEPKKRQNIDDDVSHFIRTARLEDLVQSLKEEFKARMDKIDQRNEKVDEVLNGHYRNVDRIDQNIDRIEQRLEDIKHEAEERKRAHADQFEELKGDINFLRKELAPYLKRINDANAVMRFAIWFVGGLATSAALAIAWIRGHG